MAKKIISVSLLVALLSAAFFSCKKSSNNNVDFTRNYFPLQFGKTITYAVDSTIYTDSVAHYDVATSTWIIDTAGVTYKVKSQLKYVITDTFTDRRAFKPVLSYIMDVYYRPYEGAIWIPTRVITLTPTAKALLYDEDNNRYIKLLFPITEGLTWDGNEFVQVDDPKKSYFKGWNYTYENFRRSYNNGLVNFDNTVTVLETDQSINYPMYDSLVDAFRTYAKEVYAYNVGMVYKEWTHWTYKPNNTRHVKGYSVVMRAIDYN
ncbi:MAG: hypothetical protein V4649_12690 [Bacteroidota bacterium]